ncbi:nucleotide-binding alpha-beta plait domain-containing protein [Tanacetum coccineum]
MHKRRVSAAVTNHNGGVIAHGNKNILFDVVADACFKAANVGNGGTSEANVNRPQQADVESNGNKPKQAASQPLPINDVVTADKGGVKGSNKEGCDGECSLTNLKSFASLLNSKHVSKTMNFKSLVNDERVEDEDFVLPLSAIQGVKNRFANSHVGFFVGKSLVFLVVQNYVTNTWGKFGLQKIMRNDDDFFFFKFDTKEGLGKVLERGPWMICRIPIILTKWTLSLSLTKDGVTKVPIWVKLHTVLVIAYSIDGLSLIATQLV